MSRSPSTRTYLSNLTSDIETSYCSDNDDITNHNKGSNKMNAQDGRAMFELQLELHARAVGRRPNITADDVLDVHELLVTHDGDLKSLFASQV